MSATNDQQPLSAGEAGAGGAGPALSHRDLLRALYEAVLLCREDGSIVEASPRTTRFFRVPAEAMGERAVGEFVWGLTPELLRTVVQNLADGRFTVLDANCRRGDGTTFAGEVAITRLRAGGTPLLVFSVRDVSARRRAERALRREAEEQLRQARAEQDFSGRLTILSIPDVVQLVEAARKSGELVVTGEGGEPSAQLWFLEGQVVGAACGGRTGEEAFVELLRRGGAAFHFRQGRPARTDPAIRRSTMGLLLEASRVLDEEGAG